MGAVLEYLRFLQLGWKDLFEIILVAYLIYRILLLWTGTRAFQILFGLVLLVAVYAVAQLLELGLISYILSQAFTYGVFALIVVFQPELRNALAQLGRSRFWRMRFFPKMEEIDVVEEIVAASERLSRAKIGGLIAIEREVGLGEYADSGTPVGAQVSVDLLTTIFTPHSPLHDGAVIIRGDQIAAAGCILPLTQFPISDKSLGTRHRAALGLSEETDAYIVVVSEETSQISLAHRGVLRRGLDPDRLRARLAAEREPRRPEERETREIAAAATAAEDEEIVTSVRPPEAEAAEGVPAGAEGEVRSEPRAARTAGDGEGEEAEGGGAEEGEEKARSEAVGSVSGGSARGGGSGGRGRGSSGASTGSS